MFRFEIERKTYVIRRRIREMRRQVMKMDETISVEGV